MARGITQNDVDSAADALLSSGERPTVERVRQHLGTGSPNTVTRMLEVWWKSLGSRLSERQRTMALPAAPDAVAALAGQLWEQALASARELAVAELQGDRDALEAARHEADLRVAASEQAAEHARDAQSRAAAALATAHERLDDRQRLVDQQSAQIADLTRQRAEAFDRAQHTELELATLRNRFDELHAEAEAARDAQSAHVRAVENRAHAEVDRARQESRELKRQLQTLEKTHASQLRALEADLTQARSTAAALTRDLAAEQARRETVEAQQDQLRRSLESALVVKARALAAPARTRAKPRPAARPRRAETESDQ